MNLIEVIREISKNISVLKREKVNKIEDLNVYYDTEIQKLDAALEVNKKLNTVCLNCEGKREVMQYDGAGDRESVDCPACKATGKERK